MAITKTFDGEKFAYVSDDPSCHALLTGPVFGSVSAADGTSYNVSQDWVEVKNEHVGEVMHQIGLKHEGNGNPHGRSQSDPAYNPIEDEFVHICNAACGSLRRSADEIAAAFNARLAQVGQDHIVGTEDHGNKLAHIQREVAMHTAFETESAAAPSAPAPLLGASVPTGLEG